MKRFVFLTCLGLCLLTLGSCGMLDQSNRRYQFLHVPDGPTAVDVQIEGADTQVGSLTARAPGGWELQVDGLSVQDKVAYLSAQLQVEQMKSLNYMMQILAARLGVSLDAPELERPLPPAPPTVPPTTQPED